MFFMIFFICFNANILRNMKDSLVVTAEGSGAAVIPFIKVYVMLPMAIAVTILFTKLSGRFTQEQVFYYITGGFLLFFGFFIVVLYPLSEFLHPHRMAARLCTILPHGCMGLVAMVRNWTYTLFYVACELWTAMILHVLFWGFANEVTRIGDAKRFYAAFGVSANLAAVFAGQIPRFFRYAIPTFDVFALVGVILFNGISMLCLFRWVNKNVLNTPAYKDLHSRAFRGPKSKRKLPFKESVRHLFGNPYLLCIAVVVVAYSLMINIVELVWKDQLHQYRQGFSDFNVYLGNATSAIGVLSLILSALLPFFIHRLGWTFTAMITPVAMLVTGLIFFGLMLARGVLPLAGEQLLGVVVLVGALQNTCSKACKYSVFDATKEMSFIPLDHDTKLRGKAAIDGVGSRLGKSGGSFIHQALLMVFSTLSNSVVWVSMIFIGVTSCWIVAVKGLGLQLHALVSEKGDRIGEASEEEEPAPAEAQAVT